MKYFAVIIIAVISFNCSSGTSSSAISSHSTLLADSAGKAESTPPADNSYQIHVDGFMYNCPPNFKLSVNDNGIWKEVNRYLPPKGMYYLDGTFVNYGMCDDVRCVKINYPLTVNLVEYREGQTKEAPKGNGTKVLSYTSVPLHGEIKIEFSYFTNSTCSEMKTYSETITR